MVLINQLLNLMKNYLKGDYHYLMHMELSPKFNVPDQQEVEREREVISFPCCLWDKSGIEFFKWGSIFFIIIIIFSLDNYQF